MLFSLYRDMEAELRITQYFCGPLWSVSDFGPWTSFPASKGNKIPRIIYILDLLFLRRMNEASVEEWEGLQEWRWNLIGPSSGRLWHPTYEIWSYEINNNPQIAPDPS